MTIKRTDRRFRIPNLLILAATSIAGSVAWAEEGTAAHEHSQGVEDDVDAVVEAAAEEEDKGRTEPRESWMTGPAAGNDVATENESARLIGDKTGAVVQEPADAAARPSEILPSGVSGSADAGSARPAAGATAGDPIRTTDDEIERAVEDAAAEADSGKTEPRESWMTGSRPDDEPDEAE